MAKKKSKTAPPAAPVVPVVAKAPYKRKSRAKPKPVTVAAPVAPKILRPKTCPYYKDVRVTNACTSHGWVLCETCDGVGGLGGRSFEDVRREVAKYVVAGQRQRI